MTALDLRVRVIAGLTHEDPRPTGLPLQARDDAIWAALRGCFTTLQAKLPDGPVVVLLGVEPVPPGEEWPPWVEAL